MTGGNDDDGSCCSDSSPTALLLGPARCADTTMREGTSAMGAER